MSSPAECRHSLCPECGGLGHYDVEFMGVSIFICQDCNIRFGFEEVA